MEVPTPRWATSTVGLRLLRLGSPQDEGGHRQGQRDDKAVAAFLIALTLMLLNLADGARNLTWGAEASRPSEPTVSGLLLGRINSSQELVGT